MESCAALAAYGDQGEAQRLKIIERGPNLIERISADKALTKAFV